ncbi:hypothetical protein BP6252_07205 [Coleophoma cylindrospora]|uniref:AB hydrolase-1 domain-containing protein n=1 Tax=Coleophoma cylindrospora TaxID=1849047 RepID=A0A3D8RH93_9HELO|nr:hypothetical protein BP6252_07205 [Coleophoma cylindrospora]
MIGTSRIEYIFIQTCIIGLHYLAPLCVLYCVCIFGLYGTRAFTFRFPLIIEIIAIAETLFYLLVFLPYRAYLQREAIHPPPPSREERQELFQLCNDNISDPEAYLRKWFLGAHLEDIHRENLKEFFLWAFFNRDGPPGEDEDELNGYVHATEKLLGRDLEDGWGRAKCLRLTLDKAEMLHRSLVWYFCVGFVDFLTYLRLLSHGFHFHRTRLSRFFTLFPLRPMTLLTKYRSPAKYTSYWHRPHTSTTKLPVVFIHGIGIGLYPYTKFVNELNSIAGLETSDADEQVGILLIEIMPVSFRLTHPALSREELCAEIDQILNVHFGPDQKVVLVSHSYGTVITTHLLKDPRISSRIGPVVLIDPVSILLHLPDVAYNFTRRKPLRANEHQLYYFASMDMGVAHTLARRFFWNENVLWKKDLQGHKFTVSLGGRDLIVNTEAVGEYLSSSDEGQLIELADEDAPAISRPALMGEEEDGRRSSEGTLVDEGGAAEWKNRAWKGQGTDILYFENLDHAQVFDKPGTRRRIIDVIRTYCADI